MKLRILILLMSIYSEIANGMRISSRLSTYPQVQGQMAMPMVVGISEKIITPIRTYAAAWELDSDSVAEKSSLIIAEKSSIIRPRSRKKQFHQYNNLVKIEAGIGDTSNDGSGNELCWKESGEVYVLDRAQFAKSRGPPKPTNQLNINEAGIQTGDTSKPTIRNVGQRQAGSLPAGGSKTSFLTLVMK